MFNPTVRRVKGAQAKKNGNKHSRSANRVEVTKSATACLDGADLILPCTVRDIHKRGARISVANVAALPDDFLLIIRSENLVAKVKATWRNHIEMGLQFLRTGDLNDEPRFREEQARVYQKEQKKLQKAEEEQQRRIDEQNAESNKLAQQSLLERQRQLKLLGLDPNKQLCEEDLKHAYRIKAMEIHPDHGGSREAFMELNTTYQILMAALRTPEQNDHGVISL